MIRGQIIVSVIMQTYNHEEHTEEAVKGVFMQAGDVPKTWADITELENLVYRSEVDIEKGTAKFVKWYKDYTSY
jgi:hypothetical protein